jgi:glucose-6-phosphate 1-dehydrogenase
MAHRGSRAETGTPVFGYEPGTWGPKEVDATVVPPRGWQNPRVAG